MTMCSYGGTNRIAREQFMPLGMEFTFVALSDPAKANNLLHVCDTTFATPYICKPLDFGADLCIQSMTKYYDGHNITNGGALICATEELYQRAKLVQNMHGNITSPM